MTFQTYSFLSNTYRASSSVWYEPPAHNGQKLSRQGRHYLIVRVVCQASAHEKPGTPEFKSPLAHTSKGMKSTSPRGLGEWGSSLEARTALPGTAEAVGRLQTDWVANHPVEIYGVETHKYSGPSTKRQAHLAQFGRAGDCYSPSRRFESFGGRRGS